ncbi:MAG TPA: acetoacetate decarboxylase family protein [Solirubrobacteraceae bacterium]|nr:acetoacetate decarboxylase family protein [Solirubrobacteraceae bacterium]
MTTSVEIQGRTVHLPVRSRDADSWSAQFLVPAGAAQTLVAPTGLDVMRVLPRRALASLAFARYRDSDLGAYDELALAFLVALGRRRDAGLYVHRLPTSQPFVVDAGRTIWSYPRALAAIDIAVAGGHAVCAIEQDGAHVLTLEVREGGPLRLRDPNLPNYTLADGVLRRAAWDQQGTVRARLGGGRLILGSHPMADELRALGLPRRPLMCGTMRGMRATFGAPAEVSP